MELTNYRTPGQLLEELLILNEWSQRTLAIILNINETTISKIIAGNASVTADMALMFEAVFDVEANKFLELQKRYDLERAKITAKPDPTRATRARLFGDLPISEMAKRGWINVEDIRNVPKVESELMRFFKADTLDQIEILPHAARKTDVLGDVTPTQLAWIYRVQQLADETMAARYTPSKVRAAILKLEPLMASAESVRKVPHVLAEAGIRFVIVESPKSAKIDGVSFWINAETPVIGMTLRHDRIDNFWFVLRHEMEHIDKLHSRISMMLDVDLERREGRLISDEESVADHAAANFGFTEEYLKKFISRKAPFFRELDVLGFANTANVHPGIVVGRLQHATGRYDLLRKYLVGIRSKIVPSAMVDGWGEIAQVD